MAQANDGNATLLLQRQDLLRRLSESLGSGAERLNLLDLSPARDHFATDWPRLSAKVRSIVEGTLRKCLPESDSFAALDDMCYAVISAQGKPHDVRDTLERVSEEITRRIMGENSRKVFVTITSGEAAQGGEERAVAPTAKGSNIERILGEIVAVDDEFCFDDIEYAILPMVSYDRRPTSILVPTPTCVVHGGRKRYGYDCLPPEPDTALVAELDALTAEKAGRYLGEMERQSRAGLMQVPVHRSTLSSRKYRELYLKICRGLFSRYKNKVIFDIHGIEDGTPSNRVTEHMQWLRPYGRAIAATVDLDFTTLNSFSGAALLSLGVSLDGVEDDLAEGKLNRFIPRLKSLDGKCHVHGLRTHSLVGTCISLMVGAMDGPVITEAGGVRLELVREAH